MDRSATGCITKGLIVSVGGDGGLRNVEVIVLGNWRFQIEAIRFSSGDEDETVSSPGGKAAFPQHSRRTRPAEHDNKADIG